MADNAAYAYNYLRRKGLTPAQAAGAVGGLSGESGRELNPTAVNPTSGAYGSGQWLGGRKAALMRMRNPSSIRTQLDYLWKELQGPESGAYRRLRGAHTIEDATRAWVEGFERPSAAEISSSMPTRLKNARDFFNQFSGRPVRGGVAPSVSMGSGLLGASAAAQGTTGNDRLATLAGVLQRLEAATPNIPYNSPLSRTDDQSDPATTFQGAPKSNLEQPNAGFQSSFQPTQVQSMQPTNLGDMLSQIAASRGGGSSSAPSTPSPGGGGSVRLSAEGGALASEAMKRANAINAQHLPYKWGGGHGGKITNVKNTQPLDCSGAVSAVLGIDPRVSGQFAQWGSPGDGGSKGVTIYANDEHVLMKINGHFFGTSRTNPEGGAGWIPQKALSKQYLSKFNVRHGG